MSGIYATGCPSDGAGEALVRDALPVTADVVDAAGQRERREERAPGIGDVQRGAEVAHRLVIPGARAVEQPESQDDATAAGEREALGLLLGDGAERRIGRTSPTDVSSDTGPPGG
jgi:hypothetical protein